MVVEDLFSIMLPLIQTFLFLLFFYNTGRYSSICQEHLELNLYLSHLDLTFIYYDCLVTRMLPRYLLVQPIQLMPSQASFVLVTQHDMCNEKCYARVEVARAGVTPPTFDCYLQPTNWSKISPKQQYDVISNNFLYSWLVGVVRIRS